jgi:hypothetical protein
MDNPHAWGLSIPKPLFLDSLMHPGLGRKLGVFRVIPIDP